MWRGWPGSRSSLRRSMATCVSTVRLITSSRDKIVGREESPMRLLLLSLTLLLATGDRTADRDALLAADRSLSEKTAARGMVQGFLPSMTEGAAYLYPGAPLLRGADRSEEHTSELQSQSNLVCRLLLEKKKIDRQPWDKHERTR